VHQIREFLRHSCWRKACRETPGRQKKHCHCSPQLLCDGGPPLLFHHASLSLSLSPSFSLYFSFFCRLAPAAVTLNAFHVPVSRLSSRTRKPLPAEYCLPAVFQPVRVCGPRKSTLFSDVHPSALYYGILYLHNSPPSEACKVDAKQDLSVILTYNFQDKPFETFETCIIFNKRGI